ncbi:MAG: Do family serine endopeptidase [Deltaproteobacteria bacterium]|nr:Do family serine endopeptidase [Deltaproteobacteria bacterium]
MLRTKSIGVMARARPAAILLVSPSLSTARSSTVTRPRLATSPRVVGLAFATTLLTAAACAHAGGSPPVLVQTRTSVASPGAAVVNDARVAADEPAADTGLDQLERAFERAAENIGPAVVSIISEREMARPDLPAIVRGFGPPDGTVRGLGSGVIVDGRGFILTNNHVVEGAERLRVRLHDEREFTASLVGADPKTDLAVIRIDAEHLVPAVLSSSERVRVGQFVLAAGSPFGLSKSVTAGIVSAVGRGGMGIADYGDFIQTDAAINQGNSGGPLIDLRGRVVGINTAIASHNGGSNGVGFAIPIDLAKVVLAQLVEHGSVERGWIGIAMGRLTDEMAASFGLTGKDGVLVDDVDPSGPAARSGLRPGDIITALDGKPARDMVILRNRVAQQRPGTKVALTVFRAGKSRRVELELGSLPGQREGLRPKVPEGKRATPSADKAPHGLSLADPTDELRARWRIDVRKGAVVTGIAQDSLAQAEFEPGDVIVEVGDASVRSAAQARGLLDEADLDRGIRLRVRRGGMGSYVLLHRDR